MAVLEEGHHYGLSSRNEGGDRTIIHLKLTDSALKTLEEYSKNKDVHRKATIKFQGNSGAIQIPTQGKENRTFQFSLSSIQGDLNGSFDCLEHTCSRHGGQVNSLGCMTQRVVVHATDDVYKNTKERMTLAEEESKKVCTKEIKPSGSFMRRIYKKVNKNANIPPLNKSQSAISQSWSGHHGSHHLNHHTGGASNVSVPHHNGGLSGSAGNGYSNQRLPSLHSSLHSSTSPQTGTGFSQSAKRGPARSAVLDEPYRDRIIHLLALRPYNKAELFLRLKKDGIPDKDKDSLGTLLEEVATQYKENKYTLAKHVLSEVRIDWPYYSDGERQLVRRRIATDGRSASNSPEESSPHYNNNLPNNSPYGSNNLQKRTSDNITNFVPPKKLRGSPPASGDRQLNGAPKKPVIAKIENHSTSNNVNNSTTNLMNGLSKPADHNNHIGNHAHQNSKNNHNHYNNHHNTVSLKEEVPSPTSSPDNDTLHYLNKYSMICRDNQRQEYKKDFTIEYCEYQQLYQTINKVSQKFLDWDSQMKKVSKGSPDYEKLERKIVKEYELTKNNTKFMETKNRFEFLHRKLGHIKKLVLDYDRKQMAIMKS